MKPDTDWRKIFIITILLIVLVSAFDIRFFSSVNNEDISQGEIGAADSLDLNKLKEAVKYYQNKETQFEKIRAGLATSTPVDPSL